MKINKKIKLLLRSNDLTLWLIYIFKYKCSFRIKYFHELHRIRKHAYKKCDSVKKLRALKNSRQGKKCVIVGNGPSVRFEDLDTLQNNKIDCFGSNRIVDIFDKTSWRPTFLCVQDRSFLTGYSSVMTVEEYQRIIDNENLKVFFNDDILPFMGKDIKKKRNYYFVGCNSSEIFTTRILPFSEDIPLYISDLGSVTQFCIQLACYMGYSVIYLYGIDNSFVKFIDDDGKFKVNKSQKMHMEGMKGNIDDAVTDDIPKSNFAAYKLGGFADLRKNNCGYRACKKFAASHNVGIYNITRGGALELFQRKDFDEIFN